GPGAPPRPRPGLRGGEALQAGRRPVGEAARARPDRPGAPRQDPRNGRQGDALRGRLPPQAQAVTGEARDARKPFWAAPLRRRMVFPQEADAGLVAPEARERSVLCGGLRLFGELVRGPE